MAEFGSFLLLVCGMLLAVRAGMWAAEGNPRLVDDGFVTRGGGWIDGRQASWPFVELHVTAEALELRPRTVRSFAPVRITRADQLAISTVWSPLGRGIRFDGPTLGRRLTFWPARRAAVLESMQQMAWPVGVPLGPDDRSTTVERSSGRPGERVGYRTSAAAWLLVPLVAGPVVMLQLDPPVVFALLVAAMWAWAAAITTYRIECDGIVFRCVSLLGRRSIPVGDVVTIQAPIGAAVSGGQTTITPRRGPRMVLLVLTKKDRANLQWFLDRLEALAPGITIRR